MIYVPKDLVNGFTDRLTWFAWATPFRRKLNLCVFRGGGCPQPPIGAKPLEAGRRCES